MSKIIMMTKNEYSISDVEYSKIKLSTGLVEINSGVVINISSISEIIPEEMVKKNRIKLHDGSWAIKKMGTWFSEFNPEARIDLNHYPELRDEEYKDRGDIRLSNSGLEAANFNR